MADQIEYHLYLTLRPRHSHSVGKINDSRIQGGGQRWQESCSLGLTKSTSVIQGLLLENLKTHIGMVGEPEPSFGMFTVTVTGHPGEAFQVKGPKRLIGVKYHCRVVRNPLSSIHNFKALYICNTCEYRARPT